jgi:hypothetical protein
MGEARTVLAENIGFDARDAIFLLDGLSVFGAFGVGWE